jgi:hypothetical protein
VVPLLADMAMTRLRLRPHVMLWHKMSATVRSSDRNSKKFQELSKEKRQFSGAGIKIQINFQ